MFLDVNVVVFVVIVVYCLVVINNVGKYCVIFIVIFNVRVINNGLIKSGSFICVNIC